MGSESNFYKNGQVSIDYANQDDTDEDTVFGNQSEVRRQADVRLMDQSIRVKFDKDDESVMMSD